MRHASSFPFQEYPRSARDSYSYPCRMRQNYRNTFTTRHPDSCTPHRYRNASPPSTNLMIVGLETWDDAQQDDIRATLLEIADGAGLTLVEKNAADDSGNYDEAIAVILMTDTPNGADLAAANPDTRFVAVTHAQQSSAANLTVIQLPVDKHAFLAGYLTTLISPDFRSAGLFRSDEPNGPIQVDAFMNGGRYYCGTCYPYYTPLVQFPLVGYYPSGTDVNSWLGLAEELLNNVVYVMYVDEDVADPALLSDLVAKGVILTGNRSPSETYRSMWAATIGYDVPSALQAATGFITGKQEASVITTALQIRDVNEQFFSIGKQDNVEKLRLASRIRIDCTVLPLKTHIFKLHHSP